MPFNVLKCHECTTFQVHPQTKGKKWRCKMCNEKQSFLKVFLVAGAPECRKAVQQLNMKQAEAEVTYMDRGTASVQSNSVPAIIPCTVSASEQDERPSRWSKYDADQQGQNVTDMEKENIGWSVKHCQPMGFSNISYKSSEGVKRVEASGSKWSQFLDTRDTESSSNDEEYSTPIFSKAGLCDSDTW